MKTLLIQTYKGSLYMLQLFIHHNFKNHILFDNQTLFSRWLANSSRSFIYFHQSIDTQYDEIGVRAVYLVTVVIGIVCSGAE